MIHRTLLHLGIPIALSAACLAATASLLFVGEVPPALFATVALVTYGVYAMDRLVGAREDRPSQPERSALYQRHPGAVRASVALAIGGASFLVLPFSLPVALLVPVAPLVVGLYSEPLSRRLLRGYSPGLKRHYLLKDGLIAAGWAFLLPLAFVYLRVPFGIGPLLFTLAIGMKLFVMAVVYDVKDVVADRAAGVRTLPIAVGMRTTRALLVLLTVGSTGMIVALAGTGLIPTLALLFVPASFYEVWMVRLAKPGAPGWVYTVVCDFEQVVWFACLAAGRVLLAAQ